MGNLAIVIPYFKSEFFDACLQSLVNQTSRNFNVYIGDDDSPDPPSLELSKYGGDLNLVYKKFDQNLGGRSLVSHWGRCIDMVQDEEWLMMLGDDDKLGPNCIKDFERSQPEIQDLNIDVVRFATIKIDQNEQEISKKFVHPVREKSPEFLFRKMRGETRSSLSEYIFRKDRVDEIKFKDLPLGWHTDDLAVLEVSNFGDVFSINSSIVYFRNSGLNISTLTTNLREKNRATFKFYCALLKNYSNYFTEKEKAILFHRLEKAFLNDKKNPQFYIEYFWLRILDFDFLKILGFTKRFFYSVTSGKTMTKLIKKK